MPKPRYKTTNWKSTKALTNRGSLTFCIDEKTIAEWKQNKQGKRGRPRRFSDYLKPKPEEQYNYHISERYVYQ